MAVGGAFRLHGQDRQDHAHKGLLQFGYDEKVMGRVRGAFEGKAVRSLDRNRLPKETVVVTSDFLAWKR